MNTNHLKQELTQHDLPTDGLKPALADRLPQAFWMNSNTTFHTYTNQITDAAAEIAGAEEETASLEDQLFHIQGEPTATQAGQAAPPRPESPAP